MKSRRIVRHSHASSTSRKIDSSSDESAATIEKMKSELLAGIADIIADYRDGEIDRPTPTHIERWVDQFDLHIVVIALHRYGRYYADKKISEAASKLAKKPNIKFWRAIEIEDRKIEVNRSNVLRPTAIPDDPLVQAYVQQLKYAPALR